MTRLARLAMPIVLHFNSNYMREIYAYDEENCGKLESLNSSMFSRTNISCYTAHSWMILIPVVIC